jgi:uncharacterized membrane protein
VSSSTPPVDDHFGRRAPYGLVSFVVALTGLAVSGYLRAEHYNTTLTLACPESATINCAKVTTSKWSHVGPIPVALLGLIFFVAMAALCSAPAWRIHSLNRIRIAGASIGTLSVLYLIWVELFRVNAICLWCTAVHLCTVALLAAVRWHGTSADESRSPGRR